MVSSSGAAYSVSRFYLMCAATGEAGSHNADIVEALSSWRTRAARATIILVFVIVDRLMSETNTLKQIIRCK